MNNIVQLSHVTKVYETRGENVCVLRDVTINITRGGFYAVLGHSGSGKSTLLNLIGCMDTPTHGTITIKDIDTTQLSDRALSHLRNQEVGFIFQHYNLLARLSVLHNMRLPLFYKTKTARHDDEKLKTLLDFVGLSGKFHRYPTELSGGEQQRVAIARSLVNDPSVLLADEPTGNLDDDNAFMIMELFKKLNHTLGITIIMVTHNQELTKYCSAVFTIQKGILLVARCGTEFTS